MLTEPKTGIAVLGGSFNPVTNAHLAVAQAVLSRVDDIMQVWLMPAYKHPFRKHHRYSSHRVEMLRLVESERIRYFGYEIDHRLTGITVDTFSMLQQDLKYQDYDFSMIIGSDCLFDFDRKWKHSGLLAKRIRFIVMARPRYDTDAYDGLLSKPPHILLDNAGLPDISATIARERLAAGKSVEGIVPESVAQYIEKNRLYRNHIT